MIHEIYPKKLNIDYTGQVAKADDYAIVTYYGKVMISGDENSLGLPKVGDIQDGEFRYLFSIDDMCFFTCLNAEEVAIPEGYRMEIVNAVRRHKPAYLTYAAQTGFRLTTWYNSNKYCGVCGSKMEHSHKERAMVCTSCHKPVYPVISPSVIVLLKDGDRVLLTRYQAAHNFYRNYALVAGYVETGETPEQAVAREVMEEVGLRVKNIEYCGSQPWPLSGALLLGYTCDLDGDDAITLDEEELECAVWMNRDELPDRSADISLTSDMIERFRTGRL